jgi:energy-coupling factor transporter ATP-binding protein EcfA2
MADRDATAPPSASQGASQGTSRSNKRKFKEVYDPSHSELFPEEPWYHLNYRNIIDMVNELLEEIIIGLERYIETDTGIKRLVEDAIKAKNLPDLQKCRVAVLGEQGAGKSTLLTALLGRPLLERSGKGASCTAIPVVLEQKKGAADRTHFSDIRIEWVSREEYAAHIQENIKRWTEVYPGSQDGNGDTEDAAEHDSDGEGSNAEEFAQPGPGSKKIPQTQTGAITAKEFFETIFDANNNAVAKRELEQRLHATDIRQGDFDQLCLTKVTERFQQLNAQLRVKDDVSEFHDVHDRDLGKIRSLADKLWPFVKVFIIATGNMLLRYGMCFFDLPGKMAGIQEVYNTDKGQVLVTLISFEQRTSTTSAGRPTSN